MTENTLLQVPLNQQIPGRIHSDDLYNDNDFDSSMKGMKKARKS